MAKVTNDKSSNAIKLQNYPGIANWRFVAVALVNSVAGVMVDAKVGRAVMRL